MDKGTTNDLAVVFAEAGRLLGVGEYRQALAKSRTALALAQKLENEAQTVNAYLAIALCHAHLQEHVKVLRVYDEAEPMVRRVTGNRSKDVALLMKRKAKALRSLKRFDEARTAINESMRIYEQLSGRGAGYIDGLEALARISYQEGDFEGGLKYTGEARYLLPAEDSSLLSNVLNLHAVLLVETGRSEDALLVREEHLELSLRLYGAEHTLYAIACLNTAELHAKLNGIAQAIDLAKLSFEILTKTLGPTHISTRSAQVAVAVYQKALTDPILKKKVACNADRMCSVCGKVEGLQDRCTWCGAHHLCKEHEHMITEHVLVCQKFPDLLPEEKELDMIVKCRQCRKETKLMKCSVCENVSYCGATCQKQDWKRHKLFCKKMKN